MDLFTYWRFEERYAKAGYKDIRVGAELLRLVPNVREDYDMLQFKTGVFQLEVKGVTCFLIKTQGSIAFGTYNDHCATPGGAKLLDEFLKKKYKAS